MTIGRIVIALHHPPQPGQPQVHVDRGRHHQRQRDHGGDDREPDREPERVRERRLVDDRAEGARRPANLIAAYSGMQEVDAGHEQDQPSARRGSRPGLAAAAGRLGRSAWLTRLPQPSRRPPLEHDVQDHERRAMMTTSPRPSALPTFCWPASTFPFRNDPIWIGVSGMVPAGQRLGGGVGRQRAAEQQQHAAQERRQQHRAAHVAPVLPGPRAHVVGRLAPGGPQPFQRGQDDQHHQRDLEVHVDHGHAGEGVQGEPVAVDVRARCRSATR